MGPEDGINGGKVDTQGTPEELMKADTLTAQYLNGQKEVAMPTDRRKGNGKMLSLKGASGNNLKNVQADFHLGKLILVTGVSGSGKSSLITGTRYPILNKHIFRIRGTTL